MKIAVPFENGQVFQHFGHTERFKLYEAEDGKILNERIEETNGSGHGALAGFLSELRAGVVICGGIGAGAKQALAGAGIQVYGGVSGDADRAVAAFLAGGLDYDPDVRCNHHGHEDGHCGEDHQGCAGNGGCGRS